MKVPDRGLRSILEAYLVANGWKRGPGINEWTSRNLFCAHVSLAFAAAKQVEHEQAIQDFPEGDAA